MIWRRGQRKIENEFIFLPYFFPGEEPLQYFFSISSGPTPRSLMDIPLGCEKSFYMCLSQCISNVNVAFEWNICVVLHPHEENTKMLCFYMA